MMSFKNKFIIVSFLWCYCSISLFYDFRILQARQIIAGFDISDFFLIWAASLMPFICYFLLHIPYTRRLIPFYALYVFYILISLVVGITESNNAVYIIGDLYKSFFILAGIGLYNLQKQHNRQIYSMAFKILLLFALLRLVIFFSLGVPLSRLYYGTVYDTFLVGFGLIYASSQTFSPQGNFFKRKLAAFLPVILVVIGQKKLVLVSVVVLLVGQIRSTSLIILGLITVTAASYFSSDIILILSETRLRTFLNLQDLLFAEAQRLEEFKTAYQTWTQDWVSIFFGHGFGAEIDVYLHKEGYYEKIHSVHNSVMATALRSGIIGLLVFILIGIKTIHSFLLEPHKRLLSTLLIAVFVAAQFSYTFIDELFVGLLLADITLSGRLTRPQVKRSAFLRI